MNAFRRVLGCGLIFNDVESVAGKIVIRVCRFCPGFQHIRPRSSGV